MSGPIPAHVEPRKLTDRAVAFNGQLDSRLMPRLSALLHEPAGLAEVQLQFERDEQGVRLMRGHYRLDVTLICQRCLESVTLPLDSRCVVGFVDSDEAARQLPRYYEPVIVDDETLDLHALIEDELLLALPAVPMHPDEHCQHPSGFQPDPDDSDKAEKPNPFSVLATLKRDI